MASSAPNGSSISSTSASWASARASATRWRMPPDSSCGRLSAKPPRCTDLEQLGGPPPALAPAGRRRARSASSTLRARGQPGEQRRLLEHHRDPAGRTRRPGPPSARPGRRPATSSVRLAAARGADQADELALRRRSARPGRARAPPRAAAVDLGHVGRGGCDRIGPGPGRWPVRLACDPGSGRLLHHIHEFTCGWPAAASSCSAGRGRTGRYVLDRLEQADRDRVLRVGRERRGDRVIGERDLLEGSGRRCPGPGPCPAGRLVPCWRLLRRPTGSSGCSCWPGSGP